MILGTLLLLLKAHSTTVHSESSFVEYIMNSLIRAIEFILRGVSTGAGFNLCHVYTSPVGLLNFSNLIFQLKARGRGNCLFPYDPTESRWIL